VSPIDNPVIVAARDIIRRVDPERLAGPDSMSLHYTVCPARADAHVFEITFTIGGRIAAGEPLRFARWIPGSYLIRDFAKSVLRLADGHGQPLTKIDSAGWLLPAADDGLTLRLQVHARDASVRAAWLDRERGFFNGTSLFPYLPARIHEPVTLDILPPAHAEGAHWTVATTLETVDVDARGFGRYRAADFDELVDHPVEMGAMQQVSFEACGVPHEMVIAGGVPFDETRLREDLKVICEAHLRFFGAPAPMPRYLFQTALVDVGYGGLEHRASTALMATREALPMPHRAIGQAGADGIERSEDYVTFLGLCSHEYFHTWNVKRIKPARFIPYDFDREVPTRLLWFFEGITSYYDDLTMVRAGLITRDAYLELVAKTASRVRRGAGRLVQSVTDSSLDAWTKFYKQDENSPNAIVSYYAKGALMSLCLDGWIREASGGKRSLDDLMRDLWQRWRDTGEGLAEDEPERRVAALAGEAVAERLSALLDATGDLPLEQALNTLGVALSWRSRGGSGDVGGTAAAKAAGQPWFGAVLGAGDGGARLVQVFADGPAERAGLAPGDVVVAIGGYRVDKGTLDGWLARHDGRAEVDVHAFQRGRLVVRSLPVEPSPTDVAVLGIVDEARADAWLAVSEA